MPFVYALFGVCLLLDCFFEHLFLCVSSMGYFNIVLDSSFVHKR